MRVCSASIIMMAIGAPNIISERRTRTCTSRRKACIWHTTIVAAWVWRPQSVFCHKGLDVMSSILCLLLQVIITKSMLLEFSRVLELLSTVTQPNYCNCLSLPHNLYIQNFKSLHFIYFLIAIVHKPFTLLVILLYTSI